MKPGNCIETPTAVVTIRDDGILEIRMKDGAEDNLGSVRAIEQALLRLSDAPTPVLAVLGRMKGVTAEARKYLQENRELAKRIPRSALVVGSPVSRVIGTVFARVNRSRTPIELFTSEDDAVAWLKEAFI